MANEYIPMAPEIVVTPNDNQKIVKDMFDELSAGRDQDLLNEDGIKLLNAIENGTITPNGVGSFLKGATLNWGDEITGLLNSAFNKNVKTVSTGIKERTGIDVSPSDAGVALERIKLKEFEEQNPKTAIGLELAGGVGQGVATGGATAGLTIPKLIGQGVKYGAVAGAGESESTDSRMLANTATGAGVGGVASGVMGFAGNIVKKTAKPVWSAIFGSQDDEAKKAANVVIKEAIESDAGSLDEALKIVLSKGNKPYALADIGENTRAYLDAAFMIPSPSKQAAKLFLEKRTKGMPVRITSDIKEAFGNKGAFFDEFNSLKVARSENGKKYYERAFQIKIPVTTELTTLLKRPSIQKAFDNGIAIAEEKGIKLPKVNIDKLGNLIDLKGNKIKEIDTEFMQYIKLGLDDKIFTGKSPATGIGATELNAMKDTRYAFLNYIDRHNEPYKTARNYYTGDSAAMDAMQMGRNIFKKEYTDNIELLANEVKLMNNSEKEAFRTGIMSTVMNAIGGEATEDAEVAATRNIARKFLTDTKKLRVLKETFPSEEKFKAFIGKFRTEMEMQDTSSRVLGGSATAGRQTARDTLFNTIQEINPDFNIGTMIMNVLKTDMKDLNEQQKKQIAMQVIDKLANSNKAEIAKYIKLLQGKDAGSVIKQILSTTGRVITQPITNRAVIGQQGADLSTQLITNTFPPESPYEQQRKDLNFRGGLLRQ